ncbi:DNA polymerase IV [Terrihabitans sp. B22-R8]|uniref:DNA polymerase IV n=1 Tax=Terrihabitans sp. B22-R8 TaxID=3425128 RepID=UPI00403CD960
MNGARLEPGFCRDCLAEASERPRCGTCFGPRVVRHREIHSLQVAHVDCDAFFAAIEKRDNPELRDRPVIVGGGRRGVVSTACYIARINGVRSAMPMFKALALCPEAVVVRPSHARYSAVGREVRDLMRELTPLVEPVSIDEAFLDLSGTERVHGMSAARVLAQFAKRVEKEIGITISVGLAPNKFLAKIASDLDKPRGFAVIGRAEAVEFLTARPVGMLPGVGAAARARLEKHGITEIGHLRRLSAEDAMRTLGSHGLHLWNLAHGRDERPVRPTRETKSISAETTFDEDVADADSLARTLWSLSDKVATRLKQAGFSGTRVTLKLKTADFRSRTRSRTLETPTRLAARIYETGRDLLMAEAKGERFRLIGIGVDDLHPLEDGDPPDLLLPDLPRRIAAETAIDDLRRRFGAAIVDRGIAFRPRDKS